MKKVLPSWVYRNLEEYGNCALPNDCCGMDEKALESHLSQVMKTKIKVRVAYFKGETTDYTIGKKLGNGKPYFIAEER